MAGNNADSKPTTSTSPSTPTPATSGGGVSAKVGDILRKERLTRRITIETIAKDLKLNAGYIKALEASEYATLPADPYVRVYIKSLAKYLSLDAEAVMQDFYIERGLIASDKDVSSKIDIAVKKQDKNPTVVAVAVLIVIFAVFAFIANQKGWLTPIDVSANAVAVEKSDTVNILASQDSTLKRIEDSSLAAMNAPYETTSAAPPQKLPSKR